MWIAWTVSEIIKHFLFSWLRSVWPWMKVKVNILNTWFILVSMAVTMPSLTMIASVVSKELLARDTHTQNRQTQNRQTQTTRGLVYSTFFKVALDFENKKRTPRKWSALPVLCEELSAPAARRQFSHHGDATDRAVLAPVWNHHLTHACRKTEQKAYYRNSNKLSTSICSMGRLTWKPCTDQPNLMKPPNNIKLKK